MASLSKINRFVVLMLENRSFDHVFGYTKKTNPAIDGMADTDFNYEDPLNKQRKVYVKRASASALPFDPSHEFPEVQVQLYGPAAGGGANPPNKNVPMSGFVKSSAVPGGKIANKVMECFEADQLPVLTTLAAQFGVLNYWYSSMPGPTWPNRFFVHAASSGGLTESPGKMAVVQGFNFKNGTIYDRLTAANLGWRVYHTDFPQVIGIRTLRKHYLSGSHFRKFECFQDDVTAGDLPEYTFIEPNYDVFNDFVNGNSMHPQNDVAHGEKLVKDVYETIRAAGIWDETMLIITFDEHGGFYDHNSPPPAQPTGDDKRYAAKGLNFKFDRYGVRIPTIVVSAYTKAGTVIGKKSNDPKDVFDHCSILATVEKRFGLCLQAYSPYWRAKWLHIWRETTGKDLASRIPSIVKVLEQAVVEVARLAEEGEREAVLECQRWDAQQVQWRQEEAERRAAKALKDSREELLRIIDDWAQSMKMEQFFEHAERKAAALGEDERRRMLERLRLARELAGGGDALDCLKDWKAPHER